MSRASAILVPILLATTVAAGLLAWQEYRELDADGAVGRKVEMLAGENENLRGALAAAERKATDARNTIRREQIEKQITDIRGLRFKKPVVYQTLDRAGIRQVVGEKLAAQYTDQEFADLSTGYSAMGLLPVNFPLKQTFVNLLGEQIAAFYDQHLHQLFMFQDADLENAQNRIILAHELTHALQDQNFDLLKYALEMKDNDDREYAASALVEGDATLVMTQYMMQDLSWNTLSDTVSYSATQNMVEMRKAPRYLREMLVFPYLKGQAFCAEVFARGGFPALDAVFKNPPTSTSQILHPEKYFAETREEPIEIKFKDTTLNGQKPISDNVVGEMGMRVLFSQYMDAGTAEKAADGWRGDRYLVYDGGNAFIWVADFNSPGAANEGGRALFRTCIARFPSGGSTKGGPGSTWWTDSQGHHVFIDSLGDNQIVLKVAPDEKTFNLLDAILAGESHG